MFQIDDLRAAALALAQAEGHHLPAAQGPPRAQGGAVHEILGPIRGGDEAEALARVVPFYRAAQPPRQRVQMAAARAERGRVLLLLLPARPHKRDAAVRAGQETVGGECQGEGGKAGVGMGGHEGGIEQKLEPLDCATNQGKEHNSA